MKTVWLDWERAMRLGLYSISTMMLMLTLLCACSERKEAPATRVARPDEPMGEALFALRCRDCHRIKRKGGEVGPELGGVAQRRSRRFIEQVIRDPSGTFPGTVMPLYNTLSVRQIHSLVGYLTLSQ